MSWTPRVSIPSLQGRYTRSFSDTGTVDTLAKLHGENFFTVRLSIIAWTTLLSDSPLGYKPNAVINTFVNMLINDYKGTCSRLSDLGDQLTRIGRHDHTNQTVIIEGDPRVWKNTPVFREVHHYMRTGDSQVLRYVLSVCEFGRKIGYKDKSLERNAFRIWLEDEKRLEQAHLPPYTDSLRTVVQWLFKRWAPGPFLPKHGSGSVAEKDVWGSEGKNSAFSLDPWLDSYTSRWAKTGNLSLPTPDGFPAKEAENVEQCAARLMFVPKDIDKMRSIAMERVGYMWAQQALLLAFEHWLLDGPLRNHVFLKDQTRNQVMCWHGSLTSELATVDLSRASDSILLDLIRAVATPEVLSGLLATRSPLLEIGPMSGAKVRTNKFAPMGSAVCFPVQCTIFSAIVLMVSIAQSYGRDIWNGDTIKDLDLDQAYFVCFGNGNPKYRHYKRFFVYGDDIICDKQTVSNVIRTLNDFHFIVNEEKSYVDDTAYRESCGKHYFNGYDVTPMKLKVKTVSEKASVDAMVGLVDAANRAIEYGYKHLYSMLVNVCLRYPIEGVKRPRKVNDILFVEEDSDESFALRCTEPRNTHLLHRSWYADRGRVPAHPDKVSEWRWSHVLYQRNEFMSLSIRPDKRLKVSEKFDNYSHGLWWRARYRKEVLGHEAELAKVDTKGVRVGRRWTAA